MLPDSKRMPGRFALLAQSVAGLTDHRPCHIGSGVKSPMMGRPQWTAARGRQRAVSRQRRRPLVIQRPISASMKLFAIQIAGQRPRGQTPQQLHQRQGPRLPEAPRPPWSAGRLPGRRSPQCQPPAGSAENLKVACLAVGRKLSSFLPCIQRLLHSLPRQDASARRHCAARKCCGTTAPSSSKCLRLCGLIMTAQLLRSCRCCSRSPEWANLIQHLAATIQYFTFTCDRR